MVKTTSIPLELHLGTFREEKKAAVAYNREIIKYRKEFAVLNKI